MVTHDRYFFDRVVNRTLELDGGQAIYIQEITAFFYKSVKKDASRKLLLLSGCAMFTGVNWPGSAAVRKHGGQKAGNASNVLTSWSRK